MVKSMTGYGNATAANEKYIFRIEMKSVNHRYSNISIKMPYHINYLEDYIRKLVEAQIKRGSVDIYINIDYLDDTAIDIKIDLALAKSYKESIDLLIEELDLADKVHINNIISMKDVFIRERKDLDEDEVLAPLTEALEEALTALIDMRSIEGEELKLDMLKKLQLLDDYLEIIEDKSSIVVDEYRERLNKTISGLLDEGVALDEDRLNNEVAYFADKASIDEEVVRLKSHIDQFRTILDDKDPIGRKLDFLIQELNREINTIGSKSNDIVISENVVNMKSELEKIREQVQNIE